MEHPKTIDNTSQNLQTSRTGKHILNHSETFQKLHFERTSKEFSLNSIGEESLRNSFNKYNEVSSIWEEVKKKQLKPKHCSKFQLTIKRTDDKKISSISINTLNEMKSKLNSTLSKYLNSLQSMQRTNANNTIINKNDYKESKRVENLARNYFSLPGSRHESKHVESSRPSQKNSIKCMKQCNKIGGTERMCAIKILIKKKLSIPKTTKTLVKVSSSTQHKMHTSIKSNDITGKLNEALWKLKQAETEKLEAINRYNKMKAEVVRDYGKLAKASQINKL